MQERRRNIRYQLDCPIHISTEGNTIKGESGNLAMGGMSIISFANFEVGQMIQTAFQLEQETPRCSGRINYKRPLEDKILYGIEFEETPDEMIAKIIDIRDQIKLVTVSV
jgi:hypothetical protein